MDDQLIVHLKTGNKIEEIIQRTLDKSNIQHNVRVGDILIKAGVLTCEQIGEALEAQVNGKKLKVGELLISKGFITEDILLQALATKFRLRFINLETIIPCDEALGALSEELVNRLRVFPIEFDGRTLVVATSTPTDVTVQDDLRLSTKYRIELVVASSRQITAAIDKYYHKHAVDKYAVDTLLESMEEGAQLVSVDNEGDDAQIAESDSQVIALVNLILLDAYKRGASDIHLEPGTARSPIIVRYRIDGECMTVHKIAATYKRAIIQRIKIISRLDITERRRPQSGKILIKFDQRKLEYRVEVTPIVGGHEAVVLRLLSASKPLPLSEMGFMPYNLERFKDVLNKPYGMILCVGPTGSGKTTTLHSALTHVNTPRRKIWTVEVSGGNNPARPVPSAGKYQGWLLIRRGSAFISSGRSRYYYDWRNAGQRNGQDRHRGFAHRASCIQYAPHQQRSGNCYPTH